ncbi:MAG: hypothetical protein Q8K63_06520 [Acidimicrobiales bacterium]|nr:hypothetical protein [Acidimicrobiales bacterium]
MTTTKQETKYSFTANRIAALRDEDQQSWANVAHALGLGSPGAARRAYTALVRPHTDSVLVGRTPNSGQLTPVDLADADIDQLRDAISGRVIVVQRAKGTEAIPVTKVTSVKDGTVNFNDGNKSRSVKAEAIIAVK